MFSYEKFTKSIVSNSDISSSVPYGVLSIASYIQKYSSNEIILKVLDFSVLLCTPDKIEKKFQKTMNEFKPDLVGVSALFSLVQNSIKYFCDMIKSLDSSIVTVAGGASAMNDYHRLLIDVKTLDAICYKEGEKPFLRLVDAEDPFEILNNDGAWITSKLWHKRKHRKRTLFTISKIFLLLIIVLLTIKCMGLQSILTYFQIQKMGGRITYIYPFIQPGGVHIIVSFAQRMIFTEKNALYECAIYH